MKKVAIAIPQFFDFGGSKVYMGGAERYLVDLSKLLNKLGYYVEIFQIGFKEWEREFKNIKIRSIPKTTFGYDVYPDFNIEFNNITADFDYVIYASFNLAYPHVRSKSISICHGIWWDYPIMDFYGTKKWLDLMLSCINSTSKLVSVDTNFIRWLNTTNNKELLDKVRYIPNYVDCEKFYPDVKKDKSIFTVLFPRRLAQVRGLSLAQEVSSKFLFRYPNTEFYFVGSGDNTTESQIKKWTENSIRVRYSKVDMDEMPKIYHQADVVIVPSLACEGTSLSVLEALACGKIVIASMVGGITDILVDGYNGFLIKPTVDDLYHKLSGVYNGMKYLSKVGVRARNTALSFSKERWEASWKKLIKETFR